MSENVVQIWTLGRVINYFKALFDFSAWKNGLLATTTSVETTRTVTLSIVTTMTFVRVLTSTNKVVDSHHFDLSRVSLIGAGATIILADARPLEATIEQLLLAFELLVQFVDFSLLLLDQFLETVLQLPFLVVLFLRQFGVPLFLLLFKIINLFLQHFNVEL